MLYRLPRYVCAVSLVALLLNFLPSQIQAVEEDVFSLKGDVPGLRGVSVSQMALRSDGRYLFYSTGASSWRALDMLDMVTTGDAVSVAGSVVAMALSADNRLVVVTSEGIQYFDVTKPLDPTEEDIDYERPDTAETDVFEACIDSNYNVYFLEEHAEDNEHILRYVNSNKQETGTTEWPQVFTAQAGVPSSEDIDPAYFRCADGSLLIAGINSEEEDYIDLYISKMSLSPGASSQGIFDIQEDVSGILTDTRSDGALTVYNLSVYETVDFGLDADGKNLLIFYDAPTSSTLAGDPDPDDYSQLLSISVADLTSHFLVSMGSGARAVARYKNNQTSSYSFFMDKNYFDDTSYVTADLDQLLSLATANFNANVNAASFGEDEERGDSVFPELDNYSSLSIGTGSRQFSSWLSVEKDHYVYGIAMNGQGLVRLTDAPGVYFVENPGTPEVSSSTPLAFELIADRNVSYEFRVNDNKPEEGTSSGLVLSEGRLIKTGQLTKDQGRSFSLGPNDLGIEQEALQSLLILVRSEGASEADPVSRLGVAFNYNPPPRAVDNFRLSFGDQSIHVFFDAGSNAADYESYLIYYSYDESDLDGDLPTTIEEVNARTSTITAVDGSTITSPAVINATDVFSLHHVIAPLENNVDLCVRVQVIDSNGQLSTNNPVTQCRSPLKTRSLAAALGSAASCSLNAHQSSFGGLFKLLIHSSKQFLGKFLSPGFL